MWNDIVAPMIFSKRVNDSIISYSLYLTTNSATLFKGEKGVAVLFSDGTIWNSHENIETDKIGNDWVYSAVINLTQSDVLIFSSKKILQYMLFIFNHEVEPSVADNFKGFVKCIKDAN